VEELAAINNPEDPDAGTRTVNFSKVIYIEQDDFRETPPPKYYRLFPGNEVRLRYAYFVRCESVVKDADGNIVEIHCTYDPTTKGGDSADGRKVKSTIHWVSAAHSLPAEVREYERLFTIENPDDNEELSSIINPTSLVVKPSSRVEASLGNTTPGDKFQFERIGYFCTDLTSTKEKLVFNRTVTLKDSWAKIEKKQG
jgi:glutaminyl-tRNA synthetase